MIKDCCLCEPFMPGDWIIRTDVKDPYPVQVEKKINYNIFVKDDKENIKCVKLNYCQPILITPELLMKNGFIKEDIVAQYNIYTGIDNRITMDDAEEYMDSCNSWAVYIDNKNYNSLPTCELTYLHELQHQLNFNKIEFEWKL